MSVKIFHQIRKAIAAIAPPVIRLIASLETVPSVCDYHSPELVTSLYLYTLIVVVVAYVLSNRGSVGELWDQEGMNLAQVSFSMFPPETI